MTSNNDKTAVGSQRWCPIADAPRDGSAIILGYAGSHSEEGYWMGYPDRNYWGETGWYASDENVLCEHPSNPTHWMPLPEAPDLEEA